MYLPLPGYKLSVVEFQNGEPVAPSTSKTAAVDIMSNADVTKCYDTTCFRPVGLAWDSDGRLFMSSDETGEIYAIERSNGKSVSSAGSNTSGTSPGGSGGNSNSNSMGSSNSDSSTGMASATSMSTLAIVFGILAYLL